MLRNDCKQCVFAESVYCQNGPSGWPGPSAVSIRALTVSKAAEKFQSLHVVCVLSGTRLQVSGGFVFGYGGAVKLACQSGRV